ncbi:MAG TPA: hypothetical protein VKR30_02650 [Candidatus Limnocylindrales bacterium]|nr:hypothetical protein [Candidatus Limnocylindrales bacterium]
MPSASLQGTVRRSPLALAAVVAIALFVSAAGLAVSGGGSTALASCGVVLCGSVTFVPYGNGIGEIQSTTIGGMPISGIACFWEYGAKTGTGTCAIQLPLNATLYFKLVAATGSKPVCDSFFGCVATGIKSVTVGSGTKVKTLGFALLDPVRLTVSVTGTGSGAVTSTNVPGIDCGNSHTACSLQYASGTTVHLAAAAGGSSTFAGWAGACTGTGTTCSVPMTSGTSPSTTARFDAPATPPPTAKPTPKPTPEPTPKATGAPTPAPTHAGATPGSTPIPAPTGGGGATATPVGIGGTTPSGGGAPPSAGPVAVAAGPSLAPIATPTAANGQPAASTDQGGSILIPIIVALVVLVVGGAFVFRRQGA